MGELRVAIINRSRLAREGIARLLVEDVRIAACSCFALVEDALPGIVQEAPDVVVVEFDDSKAHDAIRTLRLVRNVMAVVVSDIPLDSEQIISCAQAGVSGYIRTDADGQQWVDAICAAANGTVEDGEIGGILNRYIQGHELHCIADKSTTVEPWRVSRDVEASAKRVGLTPRERQILSLVDQGLSTKHIAKALGRSPATIKTHIQAVLTKYNVHRRSEAAAIFRSSQHLTPRSGSGEKD